MQRDNFFKLKILTPDSKLFEGEVSSINIPTQAGQITILKNHTPLISLISIGEIKADYQSFMVQGGVIDIKQSPNFEVMILADQKIDPDESINLDEEIQRAKEAMQLKKDDYDFAIEEGALEKSLFLKRFKSRK